MKMRGKNQEREQMWWGGGVEEERGRESGKGKVEGGRGGEESMGE